MKFRSKFNHRYTNHGCLNCAILKAYKAKDMQFFLQNVQNEIFKILPEQPVEKKKQRPKHHTHDISFLSLLLVIIMV